jgi:hypothetical protein
MFKGKKMKCAKAMAVEERGWGATGHGMAGLSSWRGLDTVLPREARIKTAGLDDWNVRLERT